ncbi:SRPBCC domain-containing protein [Methylocystis sp. 9N]|uniref:SRPBCC domain-containing protein n=1 Tax=Methylocystis borbori TaxID=3118750 RepID=A0ABU7XJV5_9HYPH
MTEVSETRSILTEADLAHPIDAVWRAMTDSEWLAVWFFPNDIQPVEGHKFTIWGRPIERWDGEFKCQVVAVEEPKTLSFRWWGGHEELKGFGRYMDTTVIWTISPTADGGTHFRFAQEGLPADPASANLYEVMVKGSESVLRSLAKRLPDLLEHGA